MPSRDSIERYRVANKELSGLVAAELGSYFAALDLSRPEAARNALLEFMPLLVSQYGQVSQALAMDWYEESRAESGAAGRFLATAPKPPVSDERVEAKVRYAAGHLFDQEYESQDSDGPPIVIRKPANANAALGSLTVATDKYVKQYGRETMSWNAKREGARYARVPSGAKTCAFCLVLASRDAVYLSKRSAGDSKGTGFGDDFHGDCDCAVVRIGSNEEYPEGYIPDELYDIYDIGADKAGGRNDLNAIVFDLRRRFPDRFTDGVVDEDYLARVG